MLQKDLAGCHQVEDGLQGRGGSEPEDRRRWGLWTVIGEWMERRGCLQRSSTFNMGRQHPLAHPGYLLSIQHSQALPSLCKTSATPISTMLRWPTQARTCPLGFTIQRTFIGSPLHFSHHSRLLSRQGNGDPKALPRSFGGGSIKKSGLEMLSRAGEGGRMKGRWNLGRVSPNTRSS